MKKIKRITEKHILVISLIDMKRKMIKYQYLTYLPEIKLTCAVTVNEYIENYSKHTFKIFVFHDEDTFKKKIKLHIVD